MVRAQQVALSEGERVWVALSEGEHVWVALSEGEHVWVALSEGERVWTEGTDIPVSSHNGTILRFLGGSSPLLSSLDAAPECEADLTGDSAPLPSPVRACAFHVYACVCLCVCMPMYTLLCLYV